MTTRPALAPTEGYTFCSAGSDRARHRPVNAIGRCDQLDLIRGHATECDTAGAAIARALIVRPYNRYVSGGPVDRHGGKAVDPKLLVGERLAVLGARQLTRVAIKIIEN